MPRAMILLLGAASLVAQGRPAEIPDWLVPTDQNRATWTRHILPVDAELAFEKIAWLPSFGAGVAASRKAKRPLLFYAMNGHPLGCT